MSHDGLGTLEFSAILNGDDANQIEEILRGFVRQVRKERCQALSRTGSIHRSELVSDFESSSTESDSEVTKNERRKKKRKVEDWKLDAKAYNVPFVGTSVHKGDTGHVELGCWPTGFLQVYLDKSPLATELLGSDFQRLLSKAGSNRLQTVFVQSVTELITCAIPLEKIDIFEDTSNFDGLGRINEGPTSIASSRLRIVSLVMKDHVKKLFEILNEHASSGSNQRLIIAVLECLQNLVKTSVGTAREVVRGIDKFIKDTTLKQLATYNIFDKRETKMEDGKGDYDEVENTKESKRKRLTLKVRKSFLDLTSSLLESGDQSIIFYVTSPGGKDGALKTGMAYLGLRSALQQCKDMMILSEVVSKEAHDWSSAFNKFIKLIKSLICNGHGEHVSANNQGKVKREGTLSNKAKVRHISYIQVAILYFCISLNSP
jgi:23S rRNA U2552 (ribose-2'-O)-methylase RlmE/FtsJ